MKKEKIECLVCGLLTISKRGSFEICPVCFWEDEGDIPDPTQPTYGPNGALSLLQARQNYRDIGAVNEESRKNVRSPKPEEMP